MFEDETIDISCPQCGHRNSVLVRDIEANTESHIVCEKCKVHIKIEARGFQERLDQVRKEVEELQRHAQSENKKPNSRRAKDDYQI